MRAQTHASGEGIDTAVKNSLVVSTRGAGRNRDPIRVGGWGWGKIGGWGWGKIGGVGGVFHYS